MPEINIKAIVTSQANYKKTLTNLLAKNPQKSFTAQDVGIAGQSLSRLADYGVLEVVDTIEGFIPIDKKEGTFRRVSINVYEVRCDLLSLIQNYDEYKKSIAADKIKKKIAYFQAQIDQAEQQLEKLELSY